MNSYTIFTDSACDIIPETLQVWNVKYVSLTFRFQNDEKEYTESDIPSSVFYDRMRGGAIAKTAAINSETFRAAFEPELAAGHDVLYIGFSSGLSTTYNSARMAAQELAEKYPERTILTIDSLAASAGFGLLVAMAVEKRDEGADIQTVAEYVKGLIPRLCHWFTVDDLVYLKRGGRVSPTAAFVGNLLGIKPVLYMDNEGHLIPVSKVRGRRTSIVAMADKYTEKAVDKENGTVFISHGDCLADAQQLADMLKERHGVEVKIITDVGPVIGAHSGPGTIALFFVADAR